jgi:phage I-like protein
VVSSPGGGGMGVKGENNTKLAVAVGPWRPIGELVTAADRAAASLGGDPPKEILLLPAPKWVLADMSLNITERSKKAVVAEFRSRKIDLVFDYEHQTLEAATSGIPAPASGWIKQLRADEAGIWGSAIEWTSKADAFIRAGEYRYFSPVAFFDSETLEVLSLHSVALTNTPRSNYQTPLTARAAASLISQFQTEREEKMKWYELLKATLSRKASTAPAEIAADLEKVLAAVKADGAEVAPGDATVAASIGFNTGGGESLPADVLTLMGLEATATPAKVKATILGLKNPTGMVAASEHAKVMARVKELEGQLDASTKTSKIDKLVASNKTKLPPALETEIRKIAASSGYEAAEAIVRELQPVVASTTTTSAAASSPTDGEGVEPAAAVSVGDDELRPVEPGSSSVAASCRAIMVEKGCSYSEANEIRKQRELASEAAL